MKLRCIAVDDEPLALELLEDNIRQIPSLQLVASCRNPLEAMDVLQREQVDLVFLDIQMPALTGFQFLGALAHRPMVIMVTAYDQYAKQAYDFDVIDYLTKPVAFDRFLRAVNKALELHRAKHTTTAATNTPPQPEEPAAIFLQADYQLMKVNLDDIQYVQGLKDYVKVHLASSTRPIVTKTSMKALEEKLPAHRFARIHKSYIVGLQHITSLQKACVYIGDNELPIGDSFRADFLRKARIEE